MPIYEYACPSCAHQFEFLVLRGQEPSDCPKCGAAPIERRLSLPAIKSDVTHAKAMAAAKRRDAAQGKDRAHEQLKYELSHDD
ncbi:MAG: zinc ribbon domain-containing protein [Cytophagaceae bacterium]|nr:zinc ribbon domain-containing protein [Gemmatimonadaceae bacterium]